MGKKKSQGAYSERDHQPSDYPFISEDNPYDWNGKSWFFTHNNWDESDYKFFSDIEKTYLVLGKEIAPTTGTPHLQGSITFGKNYRFSTLKKLSPRTSWSLTRDLQGSRNYCMKERDYIIQNNKSQGSRTDLHQVAEFAQTHSVREIAKEHPTLYIKYHSGIEKLHNHLHTQERTQSPIVYWIYGPTGVGKSHIVRQFCKEPLWSSEDDLKWFSGYETHHVNALFDDFRETFCSFSKLLKLLDKYPFTVQVKNGDRQWNPKRIFITSPDHPEFTFPSLKNEDLKQLTRRIHFIINIKKRGQFIDLRSKRMFLSLDQLSLFNDNPDDHLRALEVMPQLMRELLHEFTHNRKKII